MGVIGYMLSTAALLIVMVRCGVLLLGEGSPRHRPVPRAAIGLTAVAVVGVLVQACWSGAFALLADDPAKHGWWRPVTAVFLQNNVSGALWNLVSLAVVASLAEWAWGGLTMLVLFAVGALVPSHLDVLLGTGARSMDPRNFVGSSGATYFLAATLAAALLLGHLVRRSGSDGDVAARWHLGRRVDAGLAVVVPVAGLAMWFGQANGHGLVSAEGFLAGLVLAWVTVRVGASAPGAVHAPGRAPRENGARVPAAVR